MAIKKHSTGQPVKSRWRKFASTTFLVLGFILLYSVALSLVKINLTSQQPDRQRYLVSSGSIELPYLFPQLDAVLQSKQPEPIQVFKPAPDLPSENPPQLSPTPVLEQMVEPTPSALEPSPIAPLPESTQVAAEAPETPLGLNLSGPSSLYFPIISSSSPSQISEPPADNTPVEDPLAQPPPGAVAGPSAGPIVRLVVPSLKIDRAVVVVGLKKGPDNQTTWNTDTLFSTANRQDLVGQTITSANPGEGGNVILIGHNYNNGWSANGAVFVNLLSLKPGSEIIVYTESGQEFRYTVQLVKKVPWSEKSDAELQKHHKYMWPTDHEQLTLVTCGGVNLGSWSHRIYAIAIPVN